MASKMTAQHLQKLRDELFRVNGEIRSLEGRRDGLLMAIAVVNDEPVVPESEIPAVSSRKGRVPVKDIVLRLLAESADRGLVAIDIVDLAKAQGIELDRNSVSSLLSRFKRDNVVEHVGGKYRVPRPFPREVKDVA